MGGSAIASDNSGRVFFVTANGYRDSVNQNLPASGRVKLDTLSECVVNMAVNSSTGVVTQADYFEPYTYAAMDAGDRDLGSGGVILPDPGTFSGGGVERLAVAIGKNGIAYIMNADNLGGYKLGVGGTDGIIQTIPLPGKLPYFNEMLSANDFRWRSCLCELGDVSFGRRLSLRHSSRISNAGLRPWVYQHWGTCLHVGSTNTGYISRQSRHWPSNSHHIPRTARDRYPLGS